MAKEISVIAQELEDLVATIRARQNSPEAQELSRRASVAFKRGELTSIERATVQFFGPDNPQMVALVDDAERAFLDKCVNLETPTTVARPRIKGR